MNSFSHFISSLRQALHPGRGQRRSATPVVIGPRHHLFLGAAVVAIALVIGVAVAVPKPPSAAQELAAYIDRHSQSFEVPAEAATSAVSRDAYSATPGIATLAAGGTNHDWAKLVLLSGGWPMSENNVTVILRWMRQENGTADWWRRNNPLNNGYGSGGGGGTGNYANLTIAAQKAAENLGRNPGYSAIVAALASSAPTDVTERAIWASPWATGHYANGGHWSYSSVDQVKSPEGTW